MSLALWMVLLAGMLPLAAIAVAKWGLRGYDNHNPRDWLARQSGARARAVAAERNMFESFPFFAAAVLVSHVTVGPQALVDTLALIYIAARIAYLACYVLDRATFRSITWVVAYAMILTIGSSAAWLGQA